MSEQQVKSSCPAEDLLLIARVGGFVFEERG
jgi:hypothetical protein